jgi:hypothetical protein
MDTPNDYYAVLGVDSQASASSIKAAFKKLALQYHPDVYKGMDAEERMRKLLQAYQILSDPVARREYDAQRKEGNRNARGMSAGSAEARKKGAGGYEEREGYAFPDLRETPVSTFSFKLGEFVYHLSSARAENLKWDGVLRGATPEPVTTAAGPFYHCHRCHHRWPVSSPLSRGAPPPLSCPACHARDWAEYLLLRCTHCQAVFESKELRDPLRGNSLYHPYELYPLCPHCRRSQWCPAENGRVAALRAAAARRATLLWGSVIGGCLLVIAVLALVLLR